jgi:hypothetical protein
MLATATDEKVRTALWRGMTSDKTIGAELRQFSAAVQQRFGDDTVRAMLRSGGTQVEAASVPHQHEAAFTAVSRTVHTLKEGDMPTSASPQPRGSSSGRRSDIGAD